MTAKLAKAIPRHPGFLVAVKTLLCKTCILGTFSGFSLSSSIILSLSSIFVCFIIALCDFRSRTDNNTLWKGFFVWLILLNRVVNSLLWGLLSQHLFASRYCTVDTVDKVVKNCLEINNTFVIKVRGHQQTQFLLTQFLLTWFFTFQFVRLEQFQRRRILCNIVFSRGSILIWCQMVWGYFWPTLSDILLNKPIW